jgi:trehalose 6-phosphate phosphatase
MLMPTWLPEAAERIAAAPTVSLFLDFDGTLTPIVAEPKQAWLDASTRKALANVSCKSGIVTTIISGRSIQDLRMRVDLPDIIYAGNRGLEISGRQLEFVEPVAATRSVQLMDITDCLASRLQGISGVLVEFKGLTCTVHYRSAADTVIPTVEKAMHAAIAPFASLFQVDAGEKALDIIPRIGWHKGCAVSWINERLGLRDALCIYFGDDRTDEDAFGTLPGAMTFRIGEDSESRAKYCVESPAEVREFLQWLTIMK